MKSFFEVQPLSAVQALCRDVAPLPAERVPLAAAAGRTLAAPLVAGCDLPGFTRATMDGYAVGAADTFGASETLPAYLVCEGVVSMGEVPRVAVSPGRCVQISTGGMLPAGADAVIMVEHTRRAAGDAVEVLRPAAPGSNVTRADDDVAAGATVLPAGQRLRPQDVGLLAALGCVEVEVRRRPRVAILSTGDEVVPVDAPLRPGTVRDVNAHALAAQVLEAGGVPVPLGLLPDEQAALRAGVDRAVAGADLTLLSGGSSLGARDLTLEVFLGLPGARLLVHGVAVAPGKPFIWVEAGGHHLLGLPGQVASCLIAFHLFVEPLLERLLGREGRSFGRFRRTLAALTRNLPSAPGREEYVRVRLLGEGPDRRAEPVLGKSGLLRTLVQSDGLVRIPADCEGLDAGTAVEVLVFP